MATNKIPKVTVTAAAAAPPEVAARPSAGPVVLEEERALAAAEVALRGYKEAMAKGGAGSVITPEELQEMHRRCKSNAAAVLEQEFKKIGATDYKPAGDFFNKAVGEYHDELADRQLAMTSALRSVVDSAREKYRQRLVRVFAERGESPEQEDEDTPHMTGLERVLQTDRNALAEIRETLEEVGRCNPGVRPYIPKFWFDLEKELTAQLIDLVREKARVVSTTVEKYMEGHRITMRNHMILHPSAAKFAVLRRDSLHRTRAAIQRVCSDLPVVPLSLLYSVEEESDQIFEELRAEIVAREAEGATTFVTIIAVMTVLIAIFCFFFF